MCVCVFSVHTKVVAPICRRAIVAGHLPAAATAAAELPSGNAMKYPGSSLIVQHTGRGGRKEEVQPKESSLLREKKEKNCQLPVALLKHSFAFLLPFSFCHNTLCVSIDQCQCVITFKKP